MCMKNIFLYLHNSNKYLLIMFKKILGSINWLEILRLIIAGIMGGVSANIAPCADLANLMFNSSFIYC